MWTVKTVSLKGLPRSAFENIFQSAHHPKTSSNFLIQNTPSNPSSNLHRKNLAKELLSERGAHKVHPFLGEKHSNQFRALNERGWIKWLVWKFPKVFHLLQVRMAYRFFTAHDSMPVELFVLHQMSPMEIRRVWLCNSAMLVNGLKSGLSKWDSKCGYKAVLRSKPRNY